MLQLRPALLVSIVCTALLPSAIAATQLLPLNFVFSGSTPGAASPWLSATFEDGPLPDSVRLTLDATNLTGTEFAASWYFNLNPSLDPASLTFSFVSNPTALGLNNIHTGVNAFKADGDGHYDILLDFPPPPGSFAQKFTAGETVILDIQRVGGLTVADFLFESVQSSGNGTYVSAAHVQGLSGGGSAWIGTPPTAAIPEPPLVAAVLGAGLVLSLARRHWPARSPRHSRYDTGERISRV
jgi:hypothetical protein